MLILISAVGREWWSGASLFDDFCGCDIIMMHASGNSQNPTDRSGIDCKDAVYRVIAVIAPSPREIETVFRISRNHRPVSQNHIPREQACRDNIRRDPALPPFQQRKSDTDTHIDYITQHASHIALSSHKHTA